MDTLVAPATPAEAVPGTSKFMESITKDIASVGQPPPPAAIAPVTATPAAQPAPAPAVAPASTTTTPAAKPDATAQPAPAAPANDDDVELPKNISGAKAEDWQKLLSQRDKYKTRAQTVADQLKAKDDEIAKFKAKPQVDPEFQAKHEALQKERDEYSALVERVSIENHPKFKAHFGARFEQAVAAAKTAAGDKADQVLAILEALPSKWRKEAWTALLTEVENEGDKYDLAAAKNEYDRVRAEKVKLLENSKGEAVRLRETEALEKAERDKQHATIRENSYQEALRAARGFEAFKTIEGNEAHNQTVAANEANLRRLITGDGLTKEAYIGAAIQAAESVRLKGVVDTLTKERDELAKAVAEFKQATPGMRGGQPAANGTGTPIVSTPYGDSKLMGVFREGLREAGF